MEFTKPEKPGTGMTMNIAYVQNVSKEIGPTYVAAQGLRGIGYTVEMFDELDLWMLPITPATLIVGFIEPFRSSVAKLLGRPLEILNYPTKLEEFMDRKTWESTLGIVRNDPSLWPVFIKPAEEIKSFRGKLITCMKDLIEQAGLANTTRVLCSEPIEFLSEYRVFVQSGTVVGCRHYKGDPLVFPDADTILDMVKKWDDAPIAYCLDVGVVADKVNANCELATRLVEINAPHSAGDYGLDALIYARFLESYWCDLMGTKPLP